MESTLRTRIITAIFFSITVLALLLINEYTRLLLFAIVGLGASYEILKMNQSSKTSIWLMLLLIAIAYIAGFVFPLTGKFIFLLTLATCVFHVVYALNLFAGRGRILSFLPISILFYPAAACFFIINNLNQPGDRDVIIIFGMILLIWLTDTFAYLVGRKIGKHKLFERVSPNKTWEGFYGGGAACIIGGVLLGLYFDYFELKTWLFIATVAWIGGVIGDLTQSAIKRKYGVKDSGTILPGHGGFFDRFDSLLFIIPFVYLILHFI